MKKGENITCTVDKLIYGGRGLCRTEGMAVFADMGLPGQEVSVRLDRVKKRHAEGVVTDVLAKSGQEAEPFCKHFSLCGGCDWQHLDYAEQLRWKREFVIESLERQGDQDKDALVEMVEETVAPGEPRGYRNKMEFAFEGNGSRLRLGLRKRNSRRVFDVRDCGLMSGPVNEIVAIARKEAAASGIGAYDPRSGRGFWRFLVVRSNERGEMQVHLITAPGRRYISSAQDMATQLEEIPEVVSIVLGTRKERSQVAASDSTRPLSGNETFEMEMMERTYGLSPNAFFQVNTPGAAELCKAAVEFSGVKKKHVVYDLYSGAGTITFALAEKAERVIGFEFGREAVKAGARNARVNGINNCQFIEGPVEETLYSMDIPRADIIVVDPPRSGMTPEVVERIIELAPQKLVYVSCNPSTLGRDTALLCEMYSLKRVRPVDMFPQTHHVEAVALFELD